MEIQSRTRLATRVPFQVRLKADTTEDESPLN